MFDFIDSRAVWLIPMFIMGAVLLWRVQKNQDNEYDVTDILLDPNTRKASLDKHVLLLMALVSAWSIIVLLLRDKPIETLLLGVLGVFVVQRGVRDGIEAFTKSKEQK